MISGAPATSALVGASYAFQPNATDADGDQLAFEVTNLPEWARFDSRTGKISGTPSAEHAGTYSNISIRVSDGSANASLPRFSITVQQISSGSVTLSWTPPSENEDGSALTNLAGYRIYYGTSSDALSQTIEVKSPGLATYVVENLLPGTWYFGVKAYTSAGLESSLSNVSSKTIL